MNGQDIVICEPLRTPIGSFGGLFKRCSALQLATVVIEALVQRTGIDVHQIDEVVLGQGYPSSEAPPIGRVAALDAGLPETVTGMQVDRRCASGLQAVVDAAMQVQTGVSEVVIAGGAENMSQAPLYSVEARFGFGTSGVHLHDALTRGRETAGGWRHPIPGGMIETAENLRREFSISREEQDAFAYHSQQRAEQAKQAGYFAEETVRVLVPGRKQDVEVTEDEYPRPGTSLEALAALRPVLGRTDPEATVTAGNASGQNDAAAACIVSTRARAEELGLLPKLRLIGWARAGVEPERMGLGPVPATQRVLDRAGLTLTDIDIIELNEAFAAQVLAVTRSWGFGEADLERLNPLGSGISLGHPVGATGARIIATMAHHLGRIDGRYALETMCVGGGQGMAALFERA